MPAPPARRAASIAASRSRLPTRHALEGRGRGRQSPHSSAPRRSRPSPACVRDSECTSSTAGAGRRRRRPRRAEADAIGARNVTARRRAERSRRQRARRARDCETRRRTAIHAEDRPADTSSTRAPWALEPDKDRAADQRVADRHLLHDEALVRNVGRLCEVEIVAGIHAEPCSCARRAACDCTSRCSRGARPRRASNARAYGSVYSSTRSAPMIGRPVNRRAVPGPRTC